MRGPLFETWAAAEFVKYRANRLLAPALYYWRESSGREIDLIVERGKTLYPVEFKAGRTVAGDWFDTLGHFLGWAGGREGVLIYGGKAAQSRGGIEVRGWRAIEEAAELAFGRASARRHFPR
jgi:hypothetical protein